MLAFLTSSHDDQGESTRVIGAPLRVLMMGLAVLGLVVSSYLTYVSAVTGTLPVGCGVGSGCSEVLISKWSRWLGIPVSAPAAVLYLVVLVCLFVADTRERRVRETAWAVLLGAAVVIMGSAVWFTYLLWWVPIKALCPWCLLDHLGGLVFGVMIFWRAQVGSGLCGPKGLKRAATLAGLAGVLTVMAVQVSSPAIVRRQTGAPVDGDYDRDKGLDRHLAVLGGKFSLSVGAEPLVGSADAEHIVVAMVDYYCCPHCRHTHKILMDLVHKGDLAVLLLPVPLNQSCNPHAPEQMSARFEHSCKLARIVLALSSAARERFVQFDRWMFEPSAPRTPTEARAEAVRLIGADLFEQVMADPRIETVLQRNISAYGDSGADRLPVMMAPAAGFIEGQVKDPKQIFAWLKATEST